MKKILIILAAILLLLCPITVFADTPADISVTNGCSTLDAQIPLLGSVQLVSNTVSAVLYETNTDSLMNA